MVYYHILSRVHQLAINLSPGQYVLKCLLIPGLVLIWFLGWSKKGTRVASRSTKYMLVQALLVQNGIWKQVVHEPMVQV